MPLRPHVMAEECRCDLLALGWSQELAPGRAPVVRGTLERSHVPVMLIPPRLATADVETVMLGQHRT
jgi:hypothetical protein